MKSLTITALALRGVSAFPAVLNGLVDRATNAAGQSGCSVSPKCNTNYAVSNSQISYNPNSPTAAQKAQAAVPNCDVLTPCLTFSATEQYGNLVNAVLRELKHKLIIATLVSTTGSHAYQSPAAN